MSSAEKTTCPRKDRHCHLWIAKSGGERLIPLLQQFQEKNGYISDEAIESVRRQTGVSESEIFGVITFYTQFRLKPPGKYMIKLCDGTACHVNDSKSILGSILEELKISDGDTTDDGIFTVVPVACLGCCSLAPVIMINNETFGRLTPGSVKKILNDFRERAQKEAAEEKA